MRPLPTCVKDDSESLTNLLASWYLRAPIQGECPKSSQTTQRGSSPTPPPRHIVHSFTHSFGTSSLIPPLTPHDPVINPDTVQVLHSQINLLRQTVLDMRQTEAQEITELRRQVHSLEKSSQGSAEARLDEMDSRLREMERQPQASGLVSGFTNLPGEIPFLVQNFIATRVRSGPGVVLPLLPKRSNARTRRDLKDVAP